MITIKQLGLQPYEKIYQAMHDFTDQRGDDTLDEVWCLQHFPVFTQGLNGKPEHIIDAGDIPVVQTDRGGQVTYHGPGQLVVYPLINLRRLNLGVRDLVSRLENSVIELLASYKITAHADAKARGVYVNGAKICSVGLRIRRGCSYHGIALNVNMDLSPFTRINPCGFQQLRMTQIAELAEVSDVEKVNKDLVTILMRRFG